MPIVADAEQARTIFEELSSAGACIPAFDTENRETTEAIFRAAAEIGEELGIPDPPVIVAFTAHYAERMNIPAYTSIPTHAMGLAALRSDLERLAGPDSPFGHVHAMVVLDHAHPEGDREVWEENGDLLAGLMYDCSFMPLEENMRLTKAFVRRTRGEFLVEGAVDEIFAEISDQRSAVSNQQRPKTRNDQRQETKDFKLRTRPSPLAPRPSSLTRPEDAQRYAEETGVFLMVVNVGTEHRASASERHYRRDRAREISARVGRMLCLHGTSSLNWAELETLKEDGFLKVNIWTILERSGGQAMARDVLEHLGEILPPEEIEALRERHEIGEAVYRRARGSRPHLDFFTNAHRRDEVWMPTVVETMKHYFRAFGYAGLRSDNG